MIDPGADLNRSLENMIEPSMSVNKNKFLKLAGAG